MMESNDVTIVEVGPRDGFQSIAPFVPTATKIAFIERLHAAGINRIEGTAFVNARILPQMADNAEILSAVRALPGLDMQVLIPNQKYAEEAVAAGASHLAFVLSVSEKHNLSNVRRKPEESIADYLQIAAMLPDTKVRLNIATAFDCPFDGPVPPSDTLSVLHRVLAAECDAEIALCDTTGRVTPDRVRALFKTCIGHFPSVRHWAFHGHDTYGLGVANVLAALQAGIRIVDASFAGLGGCPFAPGATGNVATEDVVWTLDRMGISTGIDLASLLAIAQEGSTLPGASSGGRVRDALRGARCSGMG